jgi:hypothetical protein
LLRFCQSALRLTRRHGPLRRNGGRRPAIHTLGHQAKGTDANLRRHGEGAWPESRFRLGIVLISIFCVDRPFRREARYVLVASPPIPV